MIGFRQHEREDVASPSAVAAACRSCHCCGRYTTGDGGRGEQVGEK